MRISVKMKLTGAFGIVIALTAAVEDKVTQQNASASEQVSGTSEELSTQAERSKAFDMLRGSAKKPAASSKAARAAHGGFTLALDGGDDEDQQFRRA